MIATMLEKAFELSIDPSVYGTFAEIGAGQETANYFFRATGAAGLVELFGRWFKSGVTLHVFPLHFSGQGDAGFSINRNPSRSTCSGISGWQ
jgi:hypothetical protein